MKTIIQITATVDDGNHYLYALCADGTIWYRIRNATGWTGWLGVSANLPA